jgi:integrase
MSYRPLTRDRYLNDDELAALLDTVRARRHVNVPRDLAFFALLANTGIRPAEALALTVDDLHLGGRPPWIRVVRPVRKNTATPVTELVIHGDVARAVLPWLTRCRESGGATKLFQFTRRHSARLFRSYTARAGIRQPFKVYSLRHSVGMRLWRTTRDLRLLQAIFGHVRLKASRIYVHAPQSDLLNAMEALGV